MKTIRVGILGQGRSGRDIHGACLVHDPKHYRIAAVVDALPERRKRAMEEFHCDAYADYRDLLKRKDLDLIVNAMPSHLHVPLSLKALNAGFNVLCEKPLAKKAVEVDQLIAASKKSGKVMAIFQQARFSPYFRQLQKIIRSGVLGRLVHISIGSSGFSRRWDWQTLQSTNGGNLLNNGAHVLDQALELFGKGTPKVVCYMDQANTWGDAEDYVDLVLSGEGHPVIDIEVSSCAAYPRPAYNIQATRGGLKVVSGNVEWKYFKLSEAPKHKLTRTPLSNAEGKPAYCGEQLKWYTGTWEVPKARSNYYSSIAADFYNMLYRTLTAGAPLEITPQQVRRQIAIIEECHRQNPQIYAKSRRR